MKTIKNWFFLENIKIFISENHIWLIQDKFHVLEN